MPIIGLSLEQVAKAKERKAAAERHRLALLAPPNQHWNKPPMTATEVAERQKQHLAKISTTAKLQPNHIGVDYGLGQPYQALHFSPPKPASLADLRAAYAQVFSFITGGSITNAYREAQRSVPREGVRAGEITAWRIWRVSVTDTLMSSTLRREWLPHEPMSGDVDQGAGVFCFKNAYQAMSMAFYYSVAEIIVFGSVEIWGDIVEHEHGYRAQFASVKNLETLFFNRSTQDTSLLADLQAKYHKESSPCPTSKPSSSELTSDQLKPKPASRNWRPGTFLP